METRYRGSSVAKSNSRSSEQRNVLFSSDYEVLPNTTYDLKKSKFRNGFPNGSSSDEPLFPKQFSLIIVFVVIGICFGFIKYIDNKLPIPLSKSDLTDNPNSFIEQRARNDLSALSGLGPRVCGSPANDIAAVELLMRQLNEIQRNKNAALSMEIEVAKHTGQFYLDFKEGMTSSYASVPNIVVKLDANGRSPPNDAILLNCHFDSVPGSPGASDDLISCVTMLEVLRVLSKQQTPLKNSVLFLFNGAEENFLQASHGFLMGHSGNKTSGRGHRWAKKIRTFINMEAAGAGGREILFQTGPGNGWLVQAYANSVPYPFGSAIGEEIFQSGLIPSDTDYRIFRDYAHVPGLDLAFIQNGYVYHTVYDEVDQITPGSVQHIGSNVLALTQTLGNLDYSQVEFTKERMVFFDVFGYFMVVYSEKVGIFLNVAVALITLAFAWKDANGSFSQIITNVLATFAAWSSGILAAIIVGVILNVFSYVMPYFSHPSFAFLLFGIPAIVAQVLVYSYILQGSEDYSWIAAKTTLSLIILGTTFFSRIAFIFAINVGFGIFGWFNARKLFADSQRRLLFYLFFGELFPLAMAFYLSIVSLDVFVPIMGRSGSETNPNVFVGFLAALTLTLPGFTGLVPVFVFLKKNFLRSAGLVYFVVILTLVFGIGKIPYTQKTPMRIHICDVERQWFDTDLSTVKKTDAGYWFFTMDPSIPTYYPSWSKEGLPELERLQKIDSENCTDLACALPYVFPITRLVRHTEWLPKVSGLPRALKNNVQMRVTGDEFVSQSVRRLTFSFSGPDHVIIIMSPGQNYNLTNWSLTETIPPSIVSWKNRPTYFIYHARGINMEVLEVICEFEKQEIAQTEESSPVSDAATVVDILFAGFYVHGENMKTQSFEDFQRKFPEWTYVKGWSAVTNLYTIV